MRSKHYLRRNKTSKRPARLVFIDVDSLDERIAGNGIKEVFHRAQITTARRSRGELTFSSYVEELDDIGEVWDRVTSFATSRCRVLIVCPNPVRVLTLLGHIDQLGSRGYELGTPVSSPRFTAIAWRKGTTTLLFIGHNNLFAFQNLRAAWAKDSVEIMSQTWREYIEILDQIDSGDFHLSLGAQAFGIYRHRFIQHPILVHADPRVDELERQAAYGGIYRPLWAGKAPPDTYYYLDTNAMYPAMMTRRLLPCRLAGHCGRVPISTLVDKLQRYSVVAKCLIQTDWARFPVKRKYRTVYPVGRYITTLTTPDLLDALSRDSVLEVYAAAWYDKAQLFTNFVEYFWNLRRRFIADGRPLWGKWAKAMSVALFGKFGAKRYETHCEGDSPFDHDCADQIVSLDDGSVRWYYTLAGKMWSSGPVGLSTDAFPAVMAHITAYGRQRILELVEKAGQGNTFVIVSDGLIVNQAGYDSLANEINPDRLGALKLKLSGVELETYSDTEYRLAAREWRPGVKPDAIEIDDGVFVEYIEPSLSGLARRGTPGTYIKHRRTISLTRQFKSGRADGVGWIQSLVVWEPGLRPPQPWT